jgi:hypothetical protein
LVTSFPGKPGAAISVGYPADLCHYHDASFLNNPLTLNCAQTQGLGQRIIFFQQLWVIWE